MDCVRLRSRQGRWLDTGKPDFRLLQRRIPKELVCDDGLAQERLAFHQCSRHTMPCWNTPSAPVSAALCGTLQLRDNCMLAYSRVSIRDLPGRTVGNTRLRKIRLARTVITGYRIGGFSEQFRFHNTAIKIRPVNFIRFFRNSRVTAGKLARPIKLLSLILKSGSPVHSWSHEGPVYWQSCSGDRRLLPR